MATTTTTKKLSTAEKQARADAALAKAQRLVEQVYHADVVEYFQKLGRIENEWIGAVKKFDKVNPLSLFVLLGKAMGLKGFKVVKLAKQKRATAEEAAAKKAAIAKKKEERAAAKAAKAAASK